MTPTSPEFFERLTHANRDGLWVLDDRGRTLWANDEMARILGRTPAQMLDTLASDVVDDQGRRDLAEHQEQMRAGTTGADNLDALLFRPDGTPIWVLISYAPLPEPDGSVVAWLHRITEYTERKRMHKTLLVKEQQLSTAETIAHIGSWSWTLDGDVLSWSDELFRIYRVDPESFTPTYAGFLDFLHPDDRPTVTEALHPVMEGQQNEFQWEARIVAGDGVHRWVRGLGRSQRDENGVPTVLWGTAQDVTDLKSSERAALAATGRLRLHLRVAEVSNRATNLRDALELTGTAIADGSPWRALGVFVRPDPDAPPTLVQLDAVDAAAEDLRALELVPDHDLAELAWVTGTVQTRAVERAVRPLSVVAVPVVVPDEATGVVCVAQVVADEDPLSADSSELVQHIGRELSHVAAREQSARALAHARDEAMAASASKSDFLATMSHEIRTPMNGVIGLNDLLLTTDLDRRQRDLAEGLREAGRTLLSIINDILDLSKIESGKLELEAHEFEPRTVVEQAASVQGGPASEKGLELVVDIDPELPQILSGDSVRLGQIVSNLCSNAVKFTDSGEVVIRLEVAERSPQRVLLRGTVTDTGIGVPASVRTTLFDPFTQADPSTTRRHGGTGLGLTICQRLATALGGEIGIDDPEPDSVGSRFWFTAAFEVPEHPAAPAPPKPHPGLRGRRALLVEDNPTTVRVTAEILRRWGLEVDTAPDAATGAGLLRRAVEGARTYDVVLIDQTLPGGPDDQATELGRRLPQLGHHGPTLLLGNTRGPWVEPATGPGNMHRVAKPIRLNSLHGALIAGLGLIDDAPARRTPSFGNTGSARILVAEDNPVNQLVATGFLEAMGCTAVIAANGVEAQRAARAQPRVRRGADGLPDAGAGRLRGDSPGPHRRGERRAIPGADHRDDGLRPRRGAGALSGRGHGRLPDQTGGLLGAGPGAHLVGADDGSDRRAGRPDRGRAGPGRGAGAPGAPRDRGPPGAGAGRGPGAGRGAT